ncbi:hypothetical protein V5O48_009547, partial [Marasmius crinis-equi]
FSFESEEEAKTVITDLKGVTKAPASRFCPYCRLSSHQYFSGDIHLPEQCGRRSGIWYLCRRDPPPGYQDLGVVEPPATSVTTMSPGYQILVIRISRPEAKQSPPQYVSLRSFGQ